MTQCKTTQHPNSVQDDTKRLIWPHLRPRLPTQMLTKLGRAVAPLPSHDTIHHNITQYGGGASRAPRAHPTVQEGLKGTCHDPMQHNTAIRCKKTPRGSLSSFRRGHKRHDSKASATKAAQISAPCRTRQRRGSTPCPRCSPEHVPWDHDDA